MPHLSRLCFLDLAPLTAEPTAVRATKRSLVGIAGNAVGLVWGGRVANSAMQTLASVMIKRVLLGRRWRLSRVRGLPTGHPRGADLHSPKLSQHIAKP